MTVKAGWDRDTKHCAREDCDRPRATPKDGEPASVLCRYHIDAFLARCAAIANEHEPAGPTPPPTYHRDPTDEADVCPRCEAPGKRIDHAIAGC
jgi:hypothetical protein